VNRQVYEQGPPDSRQAAADLHRYLDDVEWSPPLADRPIKRLVKRLLPASVRPVIVLAATDAVRPFAVRRARRLVTERQPALVQLGSGRRPKAGWINVDVVGNDADVPLNLSRSLPFEDATIDAIFHEHLLEHLTVEAGFSLVEESYRVLRPGGIIRMAVPDAEAYVRGYATRDGTLERLRPNRPTAMLAAQEVFLGHGHRTAYDFETLALLLAAAAFADVRRCEFQESELPDPPDGEHRRAESIYVEATKRPASEHAKV
jgi:predicted SAM-dependent methyltransferase